MTSPSPATQGQDWPAEVAGRIESVVGTVRDKTTIPAMRAVQAVVYGFLLGVVGVLLLILTVIVLVRLLDLYLPIHPTGRRVWVVDAAASAIFMGFGTFAWRKRRPRSA